MINCISAFHLSIHQVKLGVGILQLCQLPCDLLATPTVHCDATRLEIGHNLRSLRKGAGEICIAALRPPRYLQQRYQTSTYVWLSPPR